MAGTSSGAKSRYRSLRGDVEGVVSGRGGCTECGRIARKISWPEDAFFKVKVSEGVVWALNEQYLSALRARIAGDKTALRHLTNKSSDVARFVARLPRYAVLTKNRMRPAIPS